MCFFYMVLFSVLCCGVMFLGYGMLWCFLVLKKEYLSQESSSWQSVSYTTWLTNGVVLLRQWINWSNLNIAQSVFFWPFRVYTDVFPHPLCVQNVWIFRNKKQTDWIYNFEKKNNNTKKTEFWESQISPSLNCLTPWKCSNINHQFFKITNIAANITPPNSHTIISLSLTVCLSVCIYHPPRARICSDISIFLYLYI